MAKDDCNLTIEQREARKAIYYRYIDDDCSFWNNLSRKFELHCRRNGKKQVTQPFIDIVKAWLFNCPHPWKVKRDAIYFGEYEKDGWCYYYNWVHRQFGTIIRQVLDAEELAERKEKNRERDRKREIQKCKEWGLDHSQIGTIYQNKKLEDVKVRWDGIQLNKRKFPIKFFDIETQQHKLMRLDYFKEYYYEGAQR